MNIIQAVLEALESLIGNKVRAGLTMLGIVIGVAAVIAMLAIGEGAQALITDQINAMGTNLLFISQGNRQVTIRNPKPLTVADAKALSNVSVAPSVAVSAPTLSGNLAITANGVQTSVSVTAIRAAYQTIRAITISEGELITDAQDQGRSSVALIGVDTASTLFDRETNLVGETIRIAGQPFRIVGVLTSKGGSGMGSQDNLIYIPFNTGQTRLFRRQNNRVDQIVVSAVSADAVTSASAEIKSILTSRHSVKVGEEDFTIFTQEEMLSSASTITGAITMFLGGVAAISLLVGGIGIMNIMLVSVTERTREIGLRKALGARKKDILIQFLTESAILSLFGGIIGIILGWGIAFAVGKIAASLGTAITPVVGMDAVFLATAFSTIVGLFFGIYPANRAANLVPVEALRYE